MDGQLIAMLVFGTIEVLGLIITAVWVVGKINSTTESLTAAVNDLKDEVRAFRTKNEDHAIRLAVLENQVGECEREGRCHEGS